MKVITAEFEKVTTHKVLTAFGSTGKHYAQIKNGAPFDAYFAADSATPARLENEGIAIPQTRFTYAYGKIVVWSPKPNIPNIRGLLSSSDNMSQHIAVANSRLSPYGLAASQIINNLNLSDHLAEKLVRGENISQTFQWVHSGNAELGFVAFSQINNPRLAVQGSYWMPPQSLYSPIDQQAVLLKDNEAARDFMSFIKSPDAQKVIQHYGYNLP
jgi:molybdate transport system substrate-binding protein